MTNRVRFPLGPKKGRRTAATLLWTWRESRRRLSPPFRPRRRTKVHRTFVLPLALLAPSLFDSRKTKKEPRRLRGMVLFMDLAGIEPASESLSLEASPITATPFTFPHPAGEQRPSGFSSFIIRLQTQSFACIVSRNNDAGYRTYGCDRADGCDYAATANSLSAFNFKNPVLSWSGPRMASSTSKPPSKPVQALVNKSLNSSAIKPQNSGQVNKPQV